MKLTQLNTIYKMRYIKIFEIIESSILKKYVVWKKLYKFEIFEITGAPNKTEDSIPVKLLYNYDPITKKLEKADFIQLHM